MIQFFKQIFYQLEIFVLLAFKPAILFHKINQLDWYHQTLTQWVDSLNIEKGSKVLEVGCSTGVLSHHLADSAYITTAIDYSEDMIAIAKNKNSSAIFHVADATNLPFKDNEFDAVISASLINIVSDKSKAILEMQRVCKPQGAISTLVPTMGFSYKNLKQLQGNLLLQNFSRAAIRTWHWSAPKMEPDDLIQLFNQSNLNIQSINKFLEEMVFTVTAKKN